MKRGCAWENLERPSRRRLLEVGGCGLLGLSLPDVLLADTSPRRQGPFKAIPTSVDGLQICEHLPRLAKLANKYCLVRSMTHGNPGHDGGMHVCMTGHSQPDRETPYFGSVLAKVKPSEGGVPSYTWIQNLAGDVEPRYLKGGFLGPQYAPLRVGTDLDTPADPKFRFTAFDPPAGVSPSRLDHRRRLLGQVDGMHPGRDDSFRRVQERAFDLVTAERARAAFDLERESASTRDKYGRWPLGQNLLMARRLIESGVRMVTVTAWTGLPPGEKFVNVQTWDMHGEGAGLGSSFGKGHWGLGWALPRVDEAVSALLEDLEQRGLLDSTLVVMVGEFGRAPRIDRAGRDHWPVCYSAMLAGAGIKGGLVYGSSDKQGGYVQDSPVSPEDFGATLFHALGVPLETRLSPDGFTKPVSAGQPVMELFA